jgi:hypothetical protein
MKWNDSINEPRTAQWIYRLTPAANSAPVYMQFHASDANDYCYFGAWTLVVERYE